MTREPIPDGAIRIELPIVVQEREHTCGAAAVRALCRYHGVGPATEAAIAHDMQLTLDGSDPVQLVRALAAYGLACAEHRGMALDALVAELDRGRAVIVMLQAWAEPPPASYAEHWTDGHWVIAIGHDARRIYFADPLVPDARAYLAHDDLLARWHDVEGPANDRVHRYGLAVWHDPASDRRPERVAWARPMR